MNNLESVCESVLTTVNGRKDIKMLEDVARQTRIEVLKMLTEAGSGHIGGCLSCIEIIISIFLFKIRLDPKNACWLMRDRFILSKGHAAPSLYSVLARRGCIDCDLLMTLRKHDSPLQGHPSAKYLPATEVSTGSLGQGLSVSNGIALGLKIDQIPSRVYCLLGDGEMQEGQVWEAAMTAAHYKLDNLCAIIDYNKLQIDGLVDEVMKISPLKDKWHAFGWHVMTVDGHDFEQIIMALNEAERVKNQPTIIIADTIKGKGVSFYENKPEFHGVCPTCEELSLAIKELEL
jgi:transketolase